MAAGSGFRRPHAEVAQIVDRGRELFIHFTSDRGAVSLAEFNTATDQPVVSADGQATYVLLAGRLALERRGIEPYGCARAGSRTALMAALNLS